MQTPRCSSAWGAGASVEDDVTAGAETPLRFLAAPNTLASAQQLLSSLPPLPLQSQPLMVPRNTQVAVLHPNVRRVAAPLRPPGFAAAHSLAACLHYTSRHLYTTRRITALFPSDCCYNLSLPISDLSPFQLLCCLGQHVACGYLTVADAFFAMTRALPA